VFVKQTANALLSRALLLVCLAAALSPAQAPRTKPLAQDEVQQLVQSGVPAQRIVALVEQLGIEFDPISKIQASFQSSGADETVLAALRVAGAKWHIRRGTDFQSKLQYADMEQAAHAAIRLAPDLAEAHHLLGEARVGKEDYDGALTAYREALRRKPDAADSHIGVCAVLFAKEKPDEAIPECREGLRLAPNQVWGNIWLGYALAQKGDYGGSLAALREAGRLQPGLADPHVGSCSTLRSMGDPDGSMLECREALKLSPQHPWAHWQIGHTFMAKSDFAGAEASFREALRLKPDFLHAKIGLCWALGSKNELDAALTVCQEAIKQKPSDPWAQHTLGFVWERKGDFAAALEAYRAAFLALPQNSIIKGNYERMLVESQRTSDLAQRKVRARQFLDAGSFAQAEEEYRAILKDEPGNRSARFALGDALQGQSRYKEATAEYLAASHGPAVFRIKPGTPYRDSRGCTWEKERFFSKGRTGPASGKIEGTSDPALFQTLHFSLGFLNVPQTFAYRIPIADGEYRVNLYFVETWAGAFLVPTALAPGARVFNVSINGAPVFDVDIFSEVGGYHALVRSARVRVTGGALEIVFVPRTPHGAHVGGIEIIAVE
jgi:tetratricopeptide (TPR) repeat protein